MTEHRYDTDIMDTPARWVAVGDGAVGTQLRAADDFNNRQRRGQDETGSAANWLTLVITTFADKIPEPALKGTEIAERVESRWASRRRVTT